MKSKLTTENSGQMKMYQKIPSDAKRRFGFGHTFVIKQIVLVVWTHQHVADSYLQTGISTAKKREKCLRPKTNKQTNE